MRTETRRRSSPAVRRDVGDDGVAVVVLPEDEYIRLLQKADEWEPPRPPQDANGNYPAEIVGIDLARDIIKERRAMGWSHAELARRAGVRLESVYRAEHGRVLAGVRVIEKIDRALREGRAEAEN
jgi:ribosome-binding protein aMBF1 (putative translation factor)